MTPQLRLLVFLCLVSLPCSTYAQESQPTPAPEPTTETPAQAAEPFLWHVSSAAGSSYLFGTIHLGIGAQELPPVVMERLRQSQIAVFEADIRTMNAFALMSAGMYGEGESLEQHFESEAWGRLVEALPTIPEVMLRQYRPWFLFTLISQSLLPMVEPMDLSLMQTAELNLSELRFVETPDQQTAMLASISEAVMVEQIIDWLDDPAAAQEEATRLVAAYRAGDVAAVESIVMDPEDVAKWPDLYETLIYARNAQWLGPVEELVQEGGGFVAVGLGHLVGERSVVALLRERGYTVERVSAQGATDDRAAE